MLECAGHGILGQHDEVGALARSQRSELALRERRVRGIERESTQRLLHSNAQEALVLEVGLLKLKL